MSISELKRLVIAELRSEASFSFVNTRLILRTGINLNHPDRELDSARFDRVLLELRAMGFLKEGTR
jgi:hypothetical protein